ncbi:MAG: hypothetical protein ABIK78_07320 [candidate division WOR-3 bacterium]
MRVIVFILLGIFILLLIYFYVNYREFFSQINKEEISVEMLSNKVIELYEEKLNRLKLRVDSLENSAKLKRKPMPEEIKLLKEEIKKGEELLEELKRAKEEKRNELYHLCTEVYQNAKGRCEILREKVK